MVAAVSRRDPHHPAAKRLVYELRRGRWSAVHTSDYIVAEALNYVRARLDHRGAEQALLALFFGGAGMPPLTPEVLRVHSGRFAKALEAYTRYADHGLSFTDATSLVLIQEHGIGTIATLDMGFEGLVPVTDLRTLA